MFDTQTAAVQARAGLLSSDYGAAPVPVAPVAQKSHHEGVIARLFDGQLGTPDVTDEEAFRAGYIDSYKEAVKREPSPSRSPPHSYPTIDGS